MFFSILRKLALPLAAVAAVSLLAFAQDRDGAAPKRPQVGGQAPTFTATTMAGKKLDLPASYKGKLVLVDFWATWCPPCRGEIPHLRKAHEQFQAKGVEFLSVSLDESRGISSERVTAFVEKNEMTWPQVYDNATEAARSYGVSGIPAPYLIDGDSGKILAMQSDLRGDALLTTIERHLKNRNKD